MKQSLQANPENDRRMLNKQILKKAFCFPKKETIQKYFQNPQGVPIPNNVKIFIYCINPLHKNTSHNPEPVKEMQIEVGFIEKIRTTR